MSWGVKTTCLEAPGVSLGGSGVSIGGVWSLRVPKKSSCPEVLHNIHSLYQFYTDVYTKILKVTHLKSVSIWLEDVKKRSVVNSRILLRRNPTWDVLLEHFFSDPAGFLVTATAARRLQSHLLTMGTLSTETKSTCLFILACGVFLFGWWWIYQ